MAFKTECLCARLITKMHCLMCCFSKLEHIAHYKAKELKHNQNKDVSMWTHTHTHAHTHTHVCSCTHACTYTRRTHTCMQLHECTHR